MTLHKSSTTADSTSLVTVVIDVSPMAWGERDLMRQAQDKARTAAGKRSVGPCVLEEAIESLLAFGSAVLSMEREAIFLVVAVADNESAVVYPRKDALQNLFDYPETYTLDIRRMKSDVTSGIAELTSRAAAIAEDQSTASSRQAAITAAFSTCLCLINRFLVAAKARGAVSALQADHFLSRTEDEGVLGFIDTEKTKKNANKQVSTWSPRALLIQASDDRSRDYNAFMNCCFAAAKQSVVVDGCFLTAGGNKTSSSGFLEQAADLTGAFDMYCSILCLSGIFTSLLRSLAGGVFLAPSGAAQVGGALTEILYSVFLPSIHCRNVLNLPALNKVDFRARCFETADVVDMAFVCNQCLSIFRNKPKNQCPTCQAIIYAAKKAKA